MKRAYVHHGVSARVVAGAAVWATASLAFGAPPHVVVRTVSADALSGRLRSFSLVDGLHVETDGAAALRRVDAEDVVQITTDSKIAAPSSGMFMMTFGGAPAADRLVGMPGVFEDDRVTMHVVSLGAVAVPLECIATWRNLQIGDRRWEDAIVGLVDGPVEDGDRLLLTNGDRARGVVTAVDGAGFTFETRDGIETRIAHDRVVAAAVVHVPIEPRRGLRARVELVDGSCVTARALIWRERRASITLLDDVEREIDAESIVGVDVIGGRWTWLTEFTPISSEQTPMMTVDWPVHIDQNTLGEPLAVGGRGYDRGIGVHSRSSLTYDLRGAFREFITAYGIDDDSGPLADVTVRIRVDGEPRHVRESVSRGTLWGPIRIDVGRADRIDLIVDFGRFGGVQDRFDWIEPALIR